MPIFKPFHYFRRKLTYQISDAQYAKIKFRKRFGYKLNLSNPTTLNEKIQWLKLFDRTPFHTICADKYLVRKFVQELIGDKYLVPLVFHTSNPNEIVPENLPEFPIILKANHSSGCYKIVRDKEKEDWDGIRRTAKKWLNVDTYKDRKEWQYKDIKPLIIGEKLLLDKNDNIPIDYKFHCFHGEPKVIQVDIGRGSNNHFRNWYFLNWERAPFKWSSVFYGHSTDPKDIELDKPDNLNEMIYLSKRLSGKFKYVRIDWYNFENQIYFGEITFHHDGGFRPIYPFEWDIKLGNELNLNI